MTFACTSEETTGTLNHLADYLAIALSVFGHAKGYAYKVKPACARALLDFRDVLLIDRIEGINLTLKPGILKNEALLTQFISGLGSKTVSGQGIQPENLKRISPCCPFLVSIALI